MDSNSDEEQGSEEQIDLPSPDVITKYQTAADIVNRALAKVIAETKPGAKVVDLCSLGDKTLEEGLGAVYNKTKGLEKGIAFPTSISVNHCVGHYSPLPDDTTVLAEGDVVKIDLGAHIDGLISQAAHTAIATSNPTVATTGRKADIIAAAHYAGEIAHRLIKPGKKNTDVTDAINKVAEEFKCNVVEGVLSHQVKRFVIDGNKVIIGKSSVENKVEEFEFSENEAYVVDIVMSTGEGKEVETVVECSAKGLVNIQEVFYFAQRSVLYPSRPIYDHTEKKLQTKASVALRRIFRICDSDKDGVMSDKDLINFQMRCFNAPLTEEDIGDIKRVIESEAPQGVVEGGLSIVGFLFLQHMFIRKGRMETVWAVLREFGYGDDLNLTEEYLCPTLSVEFGQHTELSIDGISFFTSLFHASDHDGDDALNPEELEDLFAPSPGHPWGGKFPINTSTNPNGHVTLQGFLAQWSFTTFTDYKITLKYLAYLGYPGDRTKAITVTRGSVGDRRAHRVTRKIYQAYTFGSAGAGKTNFLNFLIRKAFIPEYVPTNLSRIVSASVPMKNENDRYLLVHEFSHESDALNNKEMLDRCDLAYLVYDAQDARSFSHVEEVYKKNSTLSPEQFALQHKLPLPRSVSPKTDKDPSPFLTQSVQTIIASDQSSSTSPVVWISGTVFVALLLGAGVYWYHNKK